MNKKLIYLSISIYYFLTIGWSAISGDYYNDFLRQNDYSLFIYYIIKLILVIIVLVIQIIEIIKDPRSYISAASNDNLDSENASYVSNYIALKVLIILLLAYDILYQILRYIYT